jgi:hypothetical protein
MLRTGSFYETEGHALRALSPLKQQPGSRKCAKLLESGVPLLQCTVKSVLGKSRQQLAVCRACCYDAAGLR